MLNTLARLAWLCNIIGTVISGQNFLQSQIERQYECYDSELCQRVLHIAMSSNYTLTNSVYTFLRLFIR